MNDDAQMWLPGHTLNCYEGDARLRGWLLTPGLLTERIREAAGRAFRMTVVHEGPDSSNAGPPQGGEQLTNGERTAVAEPGANDWRREIEMSCGSVPWMFARSRVPAETLARHPWLARIGDTPLGAALVAQGARVERSEFGYALMQPDHELVARALSRAGIAPQALWVRRSTYSIDGAPLHLREVFLPAIGVPTVDVLTSGLPTSGAP